MPIASRRSKPPARYQRPVQELVFSPWIALPFALLIGWFLASQIFSVNPRYLKLAFGAVFVIAAIRLPLPYTLAGFMLAFTIPTFVFIGDTNTLFIGFLAVLWLGKLTLRRAPRPIRSPIDWAILLYLGIHILSFVNLENAEEIRKSVQIMMFMGSGCLLFVLLVNNIRTEAHLALILNALCWTCVLVDVTGLVEYWFSYKLIPEWFLYTAGQSYVDARVGAVFGSHALLADWSAMMFFLQVMLGMRARRRGAKIWYYGLAALGVIMIFLTVNRGGAIGWGIGAIYFGWLMRYQIRWAPTILIGPAVIGALLLLQTFGDDEKGRFRLFIRLAGTQLERGVPDTRVAVWNDILQRIPDHLWIGHGPYYTDEGSTLGKWAWPHSSYLFYLYTTGVFGLMTWLWILLKVLWLSFPGWKLDFRNAAFAAAARGVIHIQLVIFAVAQMRSDHQRGNVYLFVMWILFALAVISYRLVKEGNKEAAARHTAPALSPARSL
jgi:hypothetical protein